MNPLRLLFFGLLNPRHALSVIAHEFQAVYFVVGFITLCLGCVGLSLSHHMFYASPLTLMGFCFEVWGLMVLLFAMIALVSVLVHLVVSKGHGIDDFIKLLGCALIAQMPLAIMVSVGIIAKALEVYLDNSTISTLINGVALVYLLLYLVSLFSYSIQQVYQISSIGKAFLALAVGIFLCVLLHVLVFIGSGFSFLSLFLNAF